MRKNSAMYLQMDGVTGSIPAPYLIQALDDNGDGVADAAVWKSVQTDVCDKIDGIIGKRYAVPLSAPFPPIIVTAARVFACYQIYKRRGTEDKVNPWAPDAEKTEETLDAIAAGKQPLTPDLTRAKPSVSVITAPAKTESRAGKIAI